MIVLILGLLLFLGAHSVSIVSRPWRDGAVARLGLKRFQGLYSLVALAGLVLIVVGYGMAREEPVILWEPPVFTRHLALLLMLPVFPLLFASQMPGRIRTATRHPMLLAVKIWAFTHLIANGTLADLVLFGAFLAWGVVDRISVKRHPRQPSSLPPARPWNDAVAVVGGLVLYLATLFYLHEWLIGVSPLPA